METNEEQLSLPPEWKCEELRVTARVIERYKVKKKSNLHCKHCLKVLAIGDMAMKATVLNKIIASAKAPAATSKEKC